MGHLAAASSGSALQDVEDAVLELIDDSMSTDRVVKAILHATHACPPSVDARKRRARVDWAAQAERAQRARLAQHNQKVEHVSIEIQKRRRSLLEIKRHHQTRHGLQQLAALVDCDWKSEELVLKTVLEQFHRLTHRITACTRFLPS